MFSISRGDNRIELDISIRQIIKILFIFLGIYVVYLLQDVLILLFLSFILMAASRPAVGLLEKKLKLPRLMSALVVYLGVITLLVSVLYFITQPLASEFSSFIATLPQLVDKLGETFPVLQNKLGTISDSLFTNLESSFTNTLSFTFSAFGVLIQVLSTIVLSMYLLLERDNTIRYILKASKIDEDRFFSIYDTVEQQVGAWVRGQLLLGLAVGVVTYIGLSVLGFKFALPLGVLAGILEIIPFIGPILTAIPIVLVGFSVSPIMGVLGLLLTIIVQQLENNILVPMIMKRAVGLSPVVTIVSVLVGAELFGILGSIIAVPVAAVVSSLLNIYFDGPNTIKQV